MAQVIRISSWYASDETHSMTVCLERNWTMCTRMMIFSDSVQTLRRRWRQLETSARDTTSARWTDRGNADCTTFVEYSFPRGCTVCRQRMILKYWSKTCSLIWDRGVYPSSLRKSLELCMIPVDVLVPRFERNRQRRWGWRVQQSLEAKRSTQTTRLWKSEYGSLWNWQFRIVEQRVVPRTSSRKRNGGSGPDHSPETELLMCQWRYNTKYQQSRQFKDDEGSTNTVPWSSGRPLEATVATRTRSVSMSTQITVATILLISRWK